MIRKAKENFKLLIKHVSHRFKRTKGKYTGIKSVLLLPILGLASLLWVIIRVAPKPSRLSYPCMKVAVPTAMTFLAYIIAIFTSLFSFRKAKEKLAQSKYSLAVILLLIGIAGGVFLVLHTDQYAYASPKPVNLKTRDLEANNPMGEAKGIFPGRVVWVHDPDATDENCDPGDYGHGWFLDENNDQIAIDAMLDTAVKALSGENDIAGAWDAFFKFNNSNRGKGSVGYQAGEIIFIKINRVSNWAGNISFPSYDPVYNSNYGMSETSPHLILSLLRHLVDSVGVAETDIYIGDPLRHIYSHDYDLWYGMYPDIHYMDHDRSDGGREMFTVGDSMIHYSDSGAVLRNGTWADASDGPPVYDDYVYEIFEDCEYLINVPTLKGHRRAGITMFAKNHFGSHTRESAQHLHMGLVAPDNLGEGPGNERFGYGKYRVQVDLMGYRLFREKNLIFLMDALWSAGWENTQPDKWKNFPFNNDWSSSIFISQDNVAIESVGYDFLRTEYTSTNHPGMTYANMDGAEDYLEQAADSANWTDSIPFYDPEGDGTPMPWSLGVHEHWNNYWNRYYSRNLGTGDGIELVAIPDSLLGGIDDDIELLAKPTLLRNSPNPFSISTSIQYTIPQTGDVTLTVYNITGQISKTLVNETKSPGTYTADWDALLDNGSKAPNGVYIYRLTVNTGDKRFEDANKMLLVR